MDSEETRLVDRAGCSAQQLAWIMGKPFPDDGYFHMLRQLQQSRGKSYGPYTPGSRALGMVWAGLLSNHYKKELPPIPPHLVELMMAALKLCRAARPTKHCQDNYDDAFVYTCMANRDALEAALEEMEKP